MAGVPTHQDWKEIDEEMLEDGSVGSEKEELETPKTPKPAYDYAESDENEQELVPDGGTSTAGPNEFYLPRLRNQRSALNGGTQFSDSSDDFLPEGAELQHHSRVSDLVRSQIDSYEVGGVYKLGVTVEDVAEADSLTREESEQLLDNDVEAGYDGTFDYVLETEHGRLYVNDTTVGEQGRRKEIENREIWS